MRTWSLERLGTNRLLFIGACIATLTFAACSGSGGGGSGPSDDDDDDPETFTRSGQAMNSYLVGATVCVDASLAGTCDGEEVTETLFDEANNARFVLETTSPGGSILVQATEGDTQQYEPGAEEGEGTAIDEDFDLVAPAGASIVSPLTTLVHADYVDRINELDDVSEEDRAAARDAARDAVAAELGEHIDLDGFDILNGDYLDASSGNGDVRTTSSAVGEILRAAVDDTRTAIAGEDEDPDSFSRASVAKFAAERVRENLSGVAESVGAGLDQASIVGNNQPTIQAGDNVAEAVQTVEENLEETVSRLEDIDDGEDDEEVTGATGGGGGS